MHIHFDKDEMSRVMATYKKWWDGTIDRPVISLNRYNAYPYKDTASAPVLSQSNCHDFSYSPKQLIEAWDCDMSDMRFEADGFPSVNLGCFGPGELKHLDDILAIPGLKALQWIPGGQNPPSSTYPEVYEKTVAAGKSYWVCGSCDDFFSIYSNAGGRPFFRYDCDAADNENADKLKSLIS